MKLPARFRHMADEREFNARELDKEATKLLGEPPLMETWVSHNGKTAILRAGELRLMGLSSRFYAPKATRAKPVSAKTAALGFTCSKCGAPRSPGSTGLCSACHRGKAKERFDGFAEFAVFWEDRLRNALPAGCFDEDGNQVGFDQAFTPTEEEIYGAFASSDE